MELENQIQTYENGIVRPNPDWKAIKQANIIMGNLGYESGNVTWVIHQFVRGNIELEDLPKSVDEAIQKYYKARTKAVEEGFEEYVINRDEVIIRDLVRLLKDKLVELRKSI